MGIRLGLLLSMFLLPTLGSASTPSPKRLPLAYVYHGPGVCKGCPESLRKNILLAGYQVEFIEPGEITQRNLSKASLIAVPGGEEERDVMRSLKSGEAQNIQHFIFNGGKFLGVCLGAYLTPQWLPDSPEERGLHLFHGKVINHSPTKEARIDPILWKGKSRWMYFQDGPEFKLPKIPHSDIWARYKDGSIAALQAPYGRGRVGLIGPHPEAEQGWLDDDHLNDPDGPDHDLLVDFLDGMVQKKTTRGRRF